MCCVADILWSRRPSNPLEEYVPGKVVVRLFPVRSMLLLAALGPAGVGKKRLAIFVEVAFTGSATLLYAMPVNGFVSTNGVAPTPTPEKSPLAQAAGRV